MNQQLREVVFSGIVAVRDRLLQLDNPLRLESGEPSFETPPHIKEAMARALMDNHTHYAPSTGIAPLKEAILKKVAERNRIDYLDGLDRVVVTNGGMHALYCTFATILNQGDEVIIPQPNWTATGWMIKLTGGTLKKVPLRADNDYRWDFEELEQSIGERTRAILINSPHNPTGAVMTADDLRTLLTIADRHGLYVISDEAYEDIIYEGTHVSLASLGREVSRSMQERIISCFTFSKSYAMTGWRLGYITCTSPNFAEHIKKMILYTINGVSTPTQYGGIAALEGSQDCVREMRDTYRERRDILFDGINKTDFLRCDSRPRGAFYLYAAITEKWDGTAWDLVNHLIDTYSLGSVPGDVFYDTNRTIRFSYACSTGMIETAIRNLTA